MKTIILNIILVCVCILSQAQTNYVKNPSFEEFSQCPEWPGKIFFANFWRNPLDSTAFGGSDYNNACADTSLYDYCKVPANGMFYQHAHTGHALVTCGFYDDKTVPAPPPYTGVDVREYAQGYLIRPLTSGKQYCVSVWVNLAEGSAYAHNKIGAYLDNGDINKLPLKVGSEIISVTPQVFTDSIIKDTQNWVQIEGSFIAKGNETHITIGNFFSNSVVDTNYLGPLGFPTQSYYLIDDVSVVESDLKAYAGPDVKIPIGKAGEIGRVGDPTAGAIDCKWYHNSTLIDSGAVIIVNGGSIVGEVDTYVVVQTICGNITRDTALVRTVPVGILEADEELYFSIYPNPSDGSVTISGPEVSGVAMRIYDLLGRLQYHQLIQSFPASLQVSVPPGSYVVELTDAQGNLGRRRVVIH
jgi:hypothetical protein